VVSGSGSSSKRKSASIMTGCFLRGGCGGVEPLAAGADMDTLHCNGRYNYIIDHDAPIRVENGLRERRGNMKNASYRALGRFLAAAQGTRASRSAFRQIPAPPNCPIMPRAESILIPPCEWPMQGKKKPAVGRPSADGLAALGPSGSPAMYPCSRPGRPQQPDGLAFTMRA